MSLHSLRSQNSTFILIYFVWLFFLLHILSFSLSLLCLSFFVSPGLLHTTLRQTAVFFASYNYSYSLSLSLFCPLLFTYYSLPHPASLIRRGFRTNQTASSPGPSVTHGPSVTVSESRNEGYSAAVNAIFPIIPDAYFCNLKLGTRSVFSTVSLQLPTLDDTSHHESTTKRRRYFRHFHSCWGRLS